ncbi:tetratricopeptide repeat protein [Aestuariivirga litoralis]|nr:tetratricopeptide repeat protein [Aestuariivirga litoralis]
MARDVLKQKHLDGLVKTARSSLDAGKRDEALAAARAALKLSPDHVAALRCLADALTMYGLYRFNTEFAATLIADGSLEEAVRLRKRLVERGLEETDNFLQLGYCLTLLRAYDEAATYIRRATDIFLDGIQKLPAGQGLTAEAMVPDFFIIGSAKCGTTSLFEYIAQHPLVLPPVMKEIDYLLYPERGLAWYLSHFPRRPEAALRYMTGEASVSTFTLATAAAQITAMNPAARLLALARDPVDRAISHYANNLRIGIEQRSLEEAINQELDILESGSSTRDDDYWRTQLGYVWLGLYAHDLERWLARFPREQMCILITEEMQDNQKQTLDRVFAFLGLPPHEVPNGEKHNAGIYDEQDQRRIRERMGRFFARPNERFFELIGRRLAWSGTGAAPGAPLAASASEARILFARSRWKDAAAKFGESLAAAADHPDRLEWLEQRSKALVYANDAQGAKAALNELLAASPDNPWAADGFSRLADMLADSRQRAEVLETCIRLFPHHEDHRRWTVALGRILIDSKQWTRAEQLFQIIVAAYPDEALGVFGLAKVAEEKNLPAHAVALFDIYVRRFPGDPDRRWWLIIFAHLLLRQNLLARAEQIIAAYRIAFPEEPGGLAVLALLEQKKGNGAAAAAVWNECLRAYPDHPDRKWWLPCLANLLIDQGKLDEAELPLDELLITFPNEPGGLVGLGRVATLRGDLQGAAEIWEECLTRFPGHPERRWWLPTLGHALLNAKQTERGETQFRTLLAEYPNDPIAKAGLARAAIQRQDWHAAAQLLRECLDAHPHHQNRREWENMLNDALAHLH